MIVTIQEKLLSTLCDTANQAMIAYDAHDEPGWSVGEMLVSYSPAEGNKQFPPYHSHVGTFQLVSRKWETRLRGSFSFDHQGWTFIVCTDEAMHTRLRADIPDIPQQVLADHPNYVCWQHKKYDDHEAIQEMILVFGYLARAVFFPNE